MKQVLKFDGQSPVLAILKRYSRGYLAVFILSIFSPVLYLAGPIYTIQVMERVFTSRNVDTLVALTVIALFAILTSSFLDLIRQKAMQRIGRSVNEKLGRVVFAARNREFKPGSNISTSTALADVATVTEFTSGRLIVLLFDALLSPLFLIILFFIHPVFGLLGLFLLIVSDGLSLLNLWLVKADNKHLQTSSVQANEFGNAVTRSAETIRAMGMVPQLTERWFSMQRSAINWQARVAAKSDMIAALARFLRQAQIVIIYTVGAILYLMNLTSPSVLMAVMMITMRAVGPIDAVISSWSAYANVLAAFQRLDGLILAVADTGRKISLPPPGGDVVAEHLVATGPGGDKIIVNDVSFVLREGRVLGIVGASGAGKSSLARLLAGVWQPRRGSIMIGAHELSHWDQDKLGVHLGYMPQEVELLPGTLAENIARFNLADGDSSAKLLQAAENAGIGDLVKGLPEGYNTRVGPGFHVFSGGQRQRIALARALYGDPRFVVLDEPNSNLDAAGEQALVTAIEQLRNRNATVVVVTHKLSLLNCCDDVLVMHTGTVQAFGPKEQIVNRIPRLGSAAPSLRAIEGGNEARRT